jgi:tetratricopeptide (TPR) repeat protein
MTERTYNKLHIFLIYLVLAVSVFVAYEHLRHNDFVSYDDEMYVTKNPHVYGGITGESVVRAFTTSHPGYWHPLTLLSHMLDCQLFGLNAWGHHLMSLFFHVANTLLLFLVLKKMTGQVWPSAFVAAAFALHPLHVESVAWVSERKDVLSGFFWMLTMIAYARYAEKPGIRRYLLVVLGFSLAMMSKPMVVTLPFVLLLLDYWPLGRLQWGRRERGAEGLSQRKLVKVRYEQFSLWHLVVEKVPLFILTAILGVITFIGQQSRGVVSPLAKIPLNYRIANAFISYLKYIEKTLWPSRLAVFYPHAGSNFSKAWMVLSVLLLVSLSICCIYAARRRRYLAVGWLWYVGTLVPVIGLVQVGAQAMADRYTYISMIGLLIIIAWGANDLVAKWRYLRIAAVLSAVAVLSASVVCTRIQVKHWRNNFTLFEHALKVTENNHVIHNSYGCALSGKGQLDKAVIHLSEALRISPTFSLARNNLGMVFLKQGKLDKAIACFRELLQVGEGTPEVYYNLALALAKQERYDDAVEYFTAALRLKQDYINARFYLALTLLKLGRIQPAVDHFYRVLQLKPDHLEALNALAWVLATSNDTRIRKPADAAEFAEKACELSDYRSAGALDTLAAAYAAAGNFPEAVKAAEKAVKLAEAADEKDLAEKIQERLDLYKSGRPYYDK